MASADFVFDYRLMSKKKKKIILNTNNLQLQNQYIIENANILLIRIYMYIKLNSIFVNFIQIILTVAPI